MGIFDHFTSIDDLLVELLERIGGVTEEDTHFFSYPNDGTRATITKGTTKLDFMAGTVMTPTGEVGNLGNSLRARGREYCRSLSLQADRDIIIQIGTKSKIPVFAGTWFKVAHLRFTDVKIVAAEDTRVFVIACTNPDSIEMAGESYTKDPVDVWGKTTTMGNKELSVRNHAPPITYDGRGEVVGWCDFESATPNYDELLIYSPTYGRSTVTSKNGDFSYQVIANQTNYMQLRWMFTDFKTKRIGMQASFASDTIDHTIIIYIYYYDGSTMHRTRLKYEPWDWKLSYWNSAGAYTAISTTRQYKHNVHNFATLKLVVDFDSGEYVRAFAGGEEFDMSGLTFDTTGSGEPPRVEFMIVANGKAGVLKTIYTDNVIITENEPL